MRRNQKGFTLMELMVVIVIVAILAAVAVPLYINYVKDARRTEAKAAIGALSTAMEEYFLKTNSYDGATPDVLTDETTKVTNLDAKTVDEIQRHWTIQIDPNGADGYKITLTGVDNSQNVSGYQGLGVEYDYTRGTGGDLKDKDTN